MRYFLLFPLFFLLAAFTVNTDSRKEKIYANNSADFDWDITLKDTSGKTVSLSDFKGKFIYVDIWASWCKPCLMEFDYTRELQETFKDGNVAWVFISFDNTEQAWKKAVQNSNMQGIHLFGTPKKDEIKSALNLRGIPRYVWIDTKGSMLQKDAPHPSEKSASKQLKYYLK